MPDESQEDESLGVEQLPQSELEASPGASVQTSGDATPEAIPSTDQQKSD